MIELEPNVDAYGSYARSSAIADFIELLAIRGVRPKQATLADYIHDTSWGSRIQETYLVPGNEHPDEDGEGLGDDAEEAAARVFSLLVQREECLGDLYPFQVGPNEQYIEMAHSAPGPYLALLGITMTHAFDINSGLNPRDVFEDTVSRALADVGHKAINFSRCRRSHRSFSTALVAAGSVLNLRPVPLGAPISRYAQDAGADVLAHVEAGYRPEDSIGAWTLVGQVTCGESDTWQRKLGEVQVPGWRARLACIVPPQAFLAVPHHAEQSHLEYLVSNSQRMILDRLRLTNMLSFVSADECKIIAAISSTPITRTILDW